MICIACPKGCMMTVTEDSSQESGYKVTGNQCPTGITHGIKEMTNPTRLLTSTVKIEGEECHMMPVRTDKELPKGMLLDVMKEINKAVAKSDIQVGDIIIENILDTGVNIVASKSL